MERHKSRNLTGVMLTVTIDRHHQIGTRVERAAESILNQFGKCQSSVSP
jgi:hypothetical protein